MCNLILSSSNETPLCSCYVLSFVLSLPFSLCLVLLPFFSSLSHSWASHCLNSHRPFGLSHSVLFALCSTLSFTLSLYSSISVSFSPLSHFPPFMLYTSLSLSLCSSALLSSSTFHPLFLFLSSLCSV